MSDLISRQAAIDALNDKFTIIGTTNAIVVQDYIRRVNNRLRDLPSAEPERKKGKWTVTPLFIKCSECSEAFMLIPQNYCPNCGAKMRGDGDDDRDTD